MQPFFRDPRQRAIKVVSALLVLAVASLGLSAMTGSVALSLPELHGAARELVHGGADSMAATLLELRLSRAMVAFVTSTALSLAGVMMQALLRNPLADPYVLGISAGASVGALVALLSMGALWMVDAAAFSGAVAVTLMLSIAPESRLRGMVFWMIGDLAGAPPRVLPWLVLAFALIFALRSARALNVLALHAESTATLGVPVGALRKALFFCSGVLTASAVTSAGSIGFVGLIVPHARRFAFDPDHRLLIPPATLAGGSLLVLADILARTLLAPQQSPVGVVTARIGAPLFLYQLRQLRQLRRA